MVMFSMININSFAILNMCLIMSLQMFQHLAKVNHLLVLREIQPCLSTIVENYNSYCSKK